MLKAEDITPMVPIQGVVVYKGNTVYLETHEIKNENGKFLWQEGKPFMKEDLRDLVLSLSNESFESLEIEGIMPDNVLYLKQGLNEYTLVWYLPPGKRTLHFDKKLKIKSGPIQLPGLIFWVEDNDLHVVAVADAGKPTLKTKVYKAPFHNIHEDAKVCLGTAGEAKAKETLEQELARWERRFFGSYFSHFLDKDVVAKGTNLQILFKELMASGKKFPVNKLVPSPLKTVKNLLNDIK